MLNVLKFVFAASIFLAAALAGGCSTSGSSQSAGQCKTDAECKEGFKCNISTGVCLPNFETDDETADLAESLDAEPDSNMENWEQECAETPMPNAPANLTACEKWYCDPVDYPQCWHCNAGDDPEANGKECPLSNNAKGVCFKGECVPDSPDGDADDFDGFEISDTEVMPEADKEADDIPLENCASLGGKCVKPGAPCGAGYAPSEAQPNGCDAAAGGSLCCLPAGTNCVMEGRVGNRIDQQTNNDYCCDGLSETPNSSITNGGECATPLDGSFVCGKCGDGVCGIGENFCRCEADCAKPGQCASDSDCPADYCQNSQGGMQRCTQFTSSCEASSGSCSQSSQVNDAMVCNAATGKCYTPQAACEANGGGVCSDSTACMPGYLINGLPLGCNQLNAGTPFCCLRNACVTAGGYCNVAGGPSGGCAAEYNQAPANGCPGGTAAVCCMPAKACQSDADCGTPTCEGMIPMGCVQHNPLCDNGACGSEDRQFQGSYACDDSSGTCVEVQPECEEDSDCGSPSCYDDPNGVCHNVAPRCMLGRCNNRDSVSSPGSTCDATVGACAGGLPDCSSVEGANCRNTCSAGYTQNSEYYCAQGNCCVPNATGTCAENNGACQSNRNPCPNQLPTTGPQLDCGRGQKCCMP